MNLYISLLISLFLASHANGFNITTVLSEHPIFSTFNDYLTRTNLASQINSRQTITVLAVVNSNLSPLSGKSPDVQKNILSVHVILDYFDVPKLQQLAKGTTTLTTLFQASGLARGQQGFINVTHQGSNRFEFGSAMQGAGQGSILIEPVASEPYNFSVLQVSTIIIPPGLDGPTNSTPSPSMSPSGSPSVYPTPSISPSMPPHISPQASPPMPPPTPAPSNAQPPAVTLTPAATPGAAPIADAPVADAPASNPPADDNSNTGTTLQVSPCVVFTMVFSCLFLAPRKLTQC